MTLFLVINDVVCDSARARDAEEAQLHLAQSSEAELRGTERPGQDSHDDQIDEIGNEVAAVDPETAADRAVADFGRRNNFRCFFGSLRGCGLHVGDGPISSPRTPRT